MKYRAFGRSASLLAAVGAALALPLTGCVERSLSVRSDPPGAQVALNGRDVGMTPLRVPFETYGVYEVVLSVDGHHRLRTPVEVKAPWFQQFPLDFFTEILWPFEIVDEHEVFLALPPFPASDDPVIDTRETELRTRMETGETGGKDGGI